MATTRGIRQLGAAFRSRPQRSDPGVAGRRPLRSPVRYIALGACYSLSLAALPLSGILLRSPYSGLGGPLSALLTAAIVRWRLGSRVFASAS